MIHAYDPKTYFYIRLGELLDAWIIDGLVLSFREARISMETLDYTKINAGKCQIIR
jgi:hypothetical protein